MSRSYKRHPVVKDNAGGSKFAKRRNNKMVRKVPIDEELPTRARKFFTKPFVDQYDIHDFVCRWDWDAALAWFLRICKEGHPQWYFSRGERKIETVEDFYNWWVQHYLGK